MNEESQDRRVSLQWEDIRVTTKAGRKLLKGIDGVAHPGEVVALMGASGAGKTTLLNTLLHRNLKGLVIEGKIAVNGQEIGKNITSVSAYVQQEDLFVGTLTVLEHLTLQSRLKLPSNYTDQERKDRVQEVMEQMLLEGSQSSRIGVPGLVKGISGGEMKRLAFASEILNNPPILFCDEPTTGLDSHMAKTVVKRLESLACEQGKTIICTIHQPSSEVFELFDKVVFLAQGRVAFHGSPYEAVIFFASAGFMVPDQTNPADHYIDTLAIWPGRVEECKEKCNQICDKFAVCEYKKRMEQEIEQTSIPRRLYPHKGANIFQLVATLVIRYAKDNMRNPSVLRAKFIQKAYMGLFLGLLYWQTAMNQDGINDIKGALFYYCSEITYSTIYAIMTYMPGDFPLLVREYHDGSYPVFAYYISKILSYLPIFTLDGMAMVTISYFMIGLMPSFTRFIKTIIICMFIEWNVTSLGVAICSVSPSYAVAVTVAGPLLTVFSMTGGLFTNTATMSEWISWVQYLSWFRFGYESLIINEFSDESIFSNITCTNNLGNVTETCQASGHEVIKNLNFEEKNMYINWGFMFLSTMCIYCIGYIGLVFRVKQAR